MELNTYLNFDGDCEAAFNYYAKHIGGKVTAMMKFGDSPMAEQIPAKFLDKIMHGCFDLDGRKLMGTDCTPDHPYQPIQCAHVVINVDDEKKAESIFKALADGGDVKMPLQETFWAKRYGMTVDRFGVPWMVNCAKPS
jgi:PhnB protein